MADHSDFGGERQAWGMFTAIHNNRDKHGECSQRFIITERQARGMFTTMNHGPPSHEPHSYFVCGVTDVLLTTPAVSNHSELRLVTMSNTAVSAIQWEKRNKSHKSHYLYNGPFPRNYGMAAFMTAIYDAC